MKFQHNNARIEALSDAIFAFAATLMVVSINVGNDIAVFKAEISQFVSFGISFFALILIWKVHYDFFRRTDYMDNLLIALNAVFLFVVLYFVFPLRSLVSAAIEKKASGGIAGIFEMYSLGFVLIFLCISLMYLRASQKADNAMDRATLFEKFRHFGVFVIVGVLSVLLAFFQIGVRFGLPGFIYFLIGPLSYLNAVLLRKNSEMP